MPNARRCFTISPRRNDRHGGHKGETGLTPKCKLHASLINGALNADAEDISVPSRRRRSNGRAARRAALPYYARVQGRAQAYDGFIRYRVTPQTAELLHAVGHRAILAHHEEYTCARRSAAIIMTIFIATARAMTPRG